jgi:hypothetical protein
MRERALAACAGLLALAALALWTPAASAAPPPAPFNACSQQALPAAGPGALADTLIVNGQMDAAGQEAYYAEANADGGLANARTAVAFRSVVSPIPLSSSSYSGSAYGSASTFSYAGETPGDQWPTGPGVGSIADNWQVQYWQANDYPFYYTVAASDFVTSADQPLFVGECAGDGALRLSNDQGVYLHEIVSDLAAGDGWNWSQAVDDITTTEWGEINYWVELAKALNKKVIWSEPAQGWEALAQNATAQAYFAQWGSTLVPMFASDFDTPETGHLMGVARYWAALVAHTYGMPLGESVQSWYFRQQTDLAAQISAGLPTAAATGSGTQSSVTEPPCCELDPLNTNAYAESGGEAPYGDPLNDTYRGEEPSLDPTADATQALAEYGGEQGATYYEVEGVNGVYGVAAGIAAEGPVDDMSWTASGSSNASSYMQGIEQFSSLQLASGPMATSTISTEPLYQLWDADLVSHYYTTQASGGGDPLNPSGNPVPACNGSATNGEYCVQETTGYVGTAASVSGEIPLHEYADGHSYYYTTGQSAPAGYTLVPYPSGLGSGVVGYVMSSQQPGTEPFYWMLKSADEDYFYTTDANSERPNALAAGYVDLGVSCWLFSAAPVPANSGADLVYQASPPTTVQAGSTFNVTIAEEELNGTVVSSDSTTSLALTASGGGFSCTTTPGRLTDGVATFSGCSFTTGGNSPYTLTASSTWLLPAQASVNVPPGVALVYQTPPPSSIRATATFPVVVKEEDANGDVVAADSTTALSLAASGGSFSCAGDPTTLTAGVAAFSDCRFAVAGRTPYTLTASSQSLNAASANVTVLAAVGTVDLGRMGVSGTALSWVADCAGARGESCPISGEISVVETRKGDRLVALSAKAAPKKRRLVVIVGTVAVTLAAGEREKVTLKLNATGRRLLKKHKSLAVKLRLTSGASVLSNTIVTLKTHTGHSDATRRQRPRH